MMSHWLELRRRLIQIALFFLVVFSVFFMYSKTLFHALVSPMRSILPLESSLIATHIAMPILTPLTLAADTALLCTAPFALYQAWQFIAPGLYREEKQGLGVAMALSVMLFVFGAMFCFYGVLPFLLQFFVQAVPEGVRFMPDMASTVDLITRMTLLFGLCFQVPLVCVVLVKTGLLSRASLQAARPYWIVSAFILGMLLTPPDVLAQVTLAVPLCLLYELGVLLTAFNA